MPSGEQLLSRTFGGRPLADYIRAYKDDGVVFIPGVLSAEEVGLVERAFSWKLGNPGPWASEFYADTGAVFRQDKDDSSAEASFREMLDKTTLGDVAAALFGSGPVWYLEDQLFLKEGGSAADGARRTPWHQDASYQPMGGDKTAVFWIALDELAAEHALEVVRKSHLGVTYNATRFDPEDDTAPFFDNALPRLPDIQAERDKWDIVSWRTQPGDLLVFHPGALHGGGGTPPGGRRRSLTLRFVGDDVTKEELPRTTSKPQAQGAEAAALGRPASHLDRYWALPTGAPVSEACATRVRA